MDAAGVEDVPQDQQHGDRGQHHGQALEPGAAGPRWWAPTSVVAIRATLFSPRAEDAVERCVTGRTAVVVGSSGLPGDAAAARALGASTRRIAPTPILLFHHRLPPVGESRAASRGTRIVVPANPADFDRVPLCRLRPPPVRPATDTQIGGPLVDDRPTDPASRSTSPRRVCSRRRGVMNRRKSGADGVADGYRSGGAWLGVGARSTAGTGTGNSRTSKSEMMVGHSEVVGQRARLDGDVHAGAVGHRRHRLGEDHRAGDRWSPPEPSSVPATPPGSVIDHHVGGGHGGLLTRRFGARSSWPRTAATTEW